jgi:hypothetical protein
MLVVIYKIPIRKIKKIITQLLLWKVKLKEKTCKNYYTPFTILNADLHT